MVYSEKQDQFINRISHPYLEGLALFEQLATEAYHGGRNEQMWFGPSFVDDWSDFDLHSAYPTAMAMIGMPNWRSARYTLDLSDFSMETLGFALVKFKFPASVRYPTLPVRSQNGLVFPLEGESYACTPEIKLAVSMGCSVEIKHGLVIPMDVGNDPFFPFIKDSIAKRLAAGKNKIENAFWKEATNSCYGKTAQGLREKRTYNLKEKTSERTHPSNITNPFYAAHITSLVRAVIGELINHLPTDKMVFSVTTDGFITNATGQEMQEAVKGPFCAAFSHARERLVGDPSVYEVKHAMRQVFGWRTRGQATLQKVQGKEFVLARAGIKPPIEYEDDEAKNQYILETFFNRTPLTSITLDIPTSFREIDEFDVDMVMKKMTRKVSMEFDFKRKPYAVRETVVVLPSQLDLKSTEHRHVSYSTEPWTNVAEFKAARKCRDDSWKKAPRCIKRMDDYIAYAEYFDTLLALGTKKSAYLKNADGPAKRLARDLCRAFKHGHAGLDSYQYLTANEFAEILNDAGLRKLPVKRATVENGKRSDFEPESTPPTCEVLNILDRLQQALPQFDRSAILAAPAQEGVLLMPAVGRPCPFVGRLQ